jgi:SpoVK/Ycf46/Vps4 family AAA+-type ATPase
MASATQIKSLLQSHGNRDDERFYAIALQVAAAEARQGHERLAKEIRDLVEQARRKAAGAREKSTVLSLSAPQGEVADLLESVPSDLKVRDLILEPTLRERIDRILKEQQNLSRLKENGLRPRQRLLFTGPPGCGKTMTASALASELGLALFVVRLDSLISRFLGDSLSKLRLIFDAAERTRAVYLFDEFDSIGCSRDASGEVAEMRRVLNSFLVFIERMRSNSLIIAATNHGDRLDRALFRRFDDLIEFGLPQEEQILKTINTLLTGVQVGKLSWKRLLSAAQGLSYSEITRACEESIKLKLIENRKAVTTEMLLTALTERRLFLNH